MDIKEYLLGKSNQNSKPYSAYKDPVVPQNYFQKDDIEMGLGLISVEKFETDEKKGNYSLNLLNLENKPKSLDEALKRTSILEQFDSDKIPCLRAFFKSNDGKAVKDLFTGEIFKVASATATMPAINTSNIYNKEYMDHIYELLQAKFPIYTNDKFFYLPTKLALNGKSILRRPENFEGNFLPVDLTPYYANISVDLFFPEDESSAISGPQLRFLLVACNNLARKYVKHEIKEIMTDPTLKPEQKIPDTYKNFSYDDDEPSK